MSFFFDREITLKLLADFEVEASWEADGDGNVYFLHFMLGGFKVEENTLKTMIGREEFEVIEQAVQDWWTQEGWNQALQDEADEFGDYLYEMRRDDADMHA